MKFRTQQQGMGLIGWIFSLSIFGLLFLFGLRLFPIYYDNFAVQDVLKEVARENRDKNTSQIKLWRSIEKRLNVNGIDYIKSDSFKVHRRKDSKEFALKYDARSPYLWNIDLLVKFDHRVK